MKVTLISPPAVDPRSPYLALPSLAGMLRKEGVDTELRDLGIDSLAALLRPENLITAGLRLQREGAERRRIGASTTQHRLADIATVLAERVDHAWRIMHDPVAFYDPNQLNTARETIFDCLDLLSLAAPAPLHYHISPICYDVEGIDFQSLADLLKVTANRDANLFADSWETDLLPRLQVRNPDLIGITITNRQQVIPGLTLARILRERGHFVVIGGAIYTKFTGQLAKTPTFFEHFADGMIVYEGETALLELLDELEGRRDFAKVPNFLYLNRGQVRMTRTHLEDLSALPTPDFSGLPLNRYLTPEPVLPVLLGKGCYYNRCKFCDIPYSNRISRKPYRLRPTELVVSDLVLLHSRFGCRHFEFTDETLAPRVLERLAEALEPHRDKGLCFVGYARLEPAFTPELCAKLAEMGVKKLFFGLESGAQITLNHMDKGIRVSDAPVVLKNCRDAGINFHIFSIVGFPEESEQSARETYQFFRDNVSIIDHPGNSFDIHPFGLELRTRYAEEAERLGVRIDPNELRAEFIIGVRDRWTNSRGLTQEQMRTLLEEFHLLLQQAYRRYHASPQHLWPAFEEYAMLYADWYANAEFAYMTSLAEYDDPRCYRFRWNPAALIQRTAGDQVRISSRHGEARVGGAIFEILTSRRFRRVRDILAELAALDSDGTPIACLGRQTVDGLIEAGLLQLEPFAGSTGQRLTINERPNCEHPQGILAG